MFDISGFILTGWNIIFFGWATLSSAVWISEHKPGVSCHIVPPILFFISLCSCLTSIWVYSKF